ncbi:MAG: dUTP diphosphatase [Clostridiaceae bacterium]
MNFDNLLYLEKKYDSHIEKENKLKNDNLLPKKMLAFLVSIGELANETRCYKFWSSKQPSNSNVILEKYVDSLQSLLVVGNEKNYSDIKIEDKILDLDITNQFLTLFVDANDLVICSSKDNYITLLEDFLSLGKVLKLDFDQVEKKLIIKITP